jgi:hypothetical protein
MQGDGAAIVVSGIAILFSGVTPNKGQHGMTPSGKVQRSCIYHWQSGECQH